MSTRYLTKSRFKLATECPTKLYYTGKKNIYPDRSLDDPFLMALTDGGYQVGELAKLYFPGGNDICTLDPDEAYEQTTRLLKKDNVIIYEAAIKHENLFVRVDVLLKKGKHIELVEVKAKSIHPDGDPFQTSKGYISKKWKSYLYDVAFQKYVIQKAFPANPVSAFLMLANKNAECPVDGLNQKFRVTKNADGRKMVRVSETLNDSDLTEKILTKISVDHLCDQITKNNDTEKPDPLSFDERIELYSNCYLNDEKLVSPIGSHCAKCQFRTIPDEEAQGKVSGFQVCWQHVLGWKAGDFAKPNVLDIWNFRRKDKLIAAGQIRLSDIHEEDIGIKSDDHPGLSASERQWMQVQKSVADDDSIWIDRENLVIEMASWVYPLHFIDFETTMVALPFNKGRKPYEGIAFQFSHHVIQEDGDVEHRDEYLNKKMGIFPNYDFVRALKKSLESDKGSIFRYSNHENTYLNMIYRQLRDDPSDIQDRDELCDFIRSITHSTADSLEKWQGERDMIDLWYLVKRYYYDPQTNGSNSIKDVLPAILNTSKYLQNKYSQPNYGAIGGISSHNFEDKTWVQFDNGKVVDPYKQLPKIFTDVTDHDMELLSEEDELNNGGAAMTAYARMQFEEMSDYERESIRSALLKYCELDTLAMVMIYEGWKDMITIRQ